MLTEGETWTRGQLEDLLNARFSLAGVGRFLVASQRRANEVRRRRPDAARREAAWAATGGAAWLVLACARVEPFRRRLRAGIGGWTVTILMLDWHLGMLETEDGVERNLGPADAATLLRAWLVPAVADQPMPALCAAGFATDVLDGSLARATQPTRLGRHLEGLVDAAFSAAALRGAWRNGWLGRPAIAAEALRLGIGLAYAVDVYFGRAEAPDYSVLRAGRATAPVRAAGLVVAGTGRRRLADQLVVAGSSASVLAVAAAFRSR